MAVKYAAIIVAASVALVAGQSAAQDADTAKVITAGDLADLQAHIVYAQAQAKLAGERRKANPVVDNVDIGQQAAGTALPVVTGVFGRERDLYASFLYSNGLDWQAKAGMTAPGGYLVRSITQDRVVLTKEGRTYVLGFSSVAPAEPLAKVVDQSPGSPTAASPFLPIPAERK